MPRTQHEHAYWRVLNGWSFPRKPAQAASDDSGSPVIPAKIERAVDWLETSSLLQEATIEPRTISRISGLYREGITRLIRASSDISAILSVTLASDPVSVPITRTLTDWYGQLSNAYTRAMDGPWAEVGPPPAGWNSLIHRILEGHTLPESFARVRSALPDDSLLQELDGWVRALATDFVTHAGLPILPVSLSVEQFQHIHSFLVDQLGTPSLWPADILTLNAVELSAGLIPIIAVVFRWKKATAEEFARLAGAVAIGALISANPVGVVVSLAILATAFDRVRVKGESAPSLARGAAAGVVLGGGTMAAAVSVASVAGPIGAIIAAMSAAYALKRVGRSLRELDVQQPAAFFIQRFKGPLPGATATA